MAEEETSRGSLAWFPSRPDERIDRSEWRLDVITLLAVIGESSMSEHAQTITASAFCLLPRVLPAPQALLKPSRPLRMPQTHAKMTGVYSGVVLDTVGFFANIIHPLDKLKPFSFQVLEIKHKNTDEAGDIVASRATQAAGAGAAGSSSGFARRFLFRRSDTSRSNGMRIPGPPPLEMDEVKGGGPGGKGGDEGNAPRPDGAGANVTSGRTVTWRLDRPSDADPEQGGQPAAPPPPQAGQQLRRRSTTKERMTDFVSNPTLATTHKRPAVPAALYSPVHILSVLSMLLTVAMLVCAWWWRDGPAIIAVAIISAQSALVGYASWWKPILMKRSHTNEVPRGDVMIRTREGAFVLVRCTEEVARELYHAGTECEYHVSERWYRPMMGLGTMMLMLSTVLLGNCSWYMQLFIGSSYISLNALYWAMGMLPRRLFWDLSRYEHVDVTPEDARGAHDSLKEDDPDYDPREGVASFSRTLWYAIRETKQTSWVERGGVAPATTEWAQWLVEARQAAIDGNRNWPAVARKNDILAHRQPGSRPGRGGGGVGGGGSGDPQKQQQQQQQQQWQEQQEGRPQPTPGEPPSMPQSPSTGPDLAKQHAPLQEVQVPSRPNIPDIF